TAVAAPVDAFTATVPENALTAAAGARQYRARCPAPSPSRRPAAADRAPERARPGRRGPPDRGAGLGPHLAGQQGGAPADVTALGGDAPVRDRDRRALRSHCLARAR